MTESSGYECIVLGAGMAGLTAARALAEAGRRVLVLEAQDHAGGRMLTHHVPGLARPVELGAEFVHGRPPELLALLAEAGLAIQEGEGEQRCYLRGAVQECPEDGGAWSLLDGLDEAVRRLGDISFDQFLAQSGASIEDQQRARNYVEGFNAADAREIGIAGLARQQAAEDAIEGDRVARIANGYGNLAKYVAARAVLAGATLLLNTPIAQVEWQSGRCTVTAVDGQQWTAKTIVCALPLGVLQHMQDLFRPVPQQAIAALLSLRAGSVERIVLQFRGRWWAAAEPRMHFLFAQQLYPPTWWTTAPIESPLLTGWAGGPKVQRGMDAAALGKQALATLEQMFHCPLGDELVAVHYHDWQSDPYSRGAYSYAPAGAVEASGVLAQPIEKTLVFAGEHADITGHPGTVHGAMRSGTRAAQQVLALLQERA